MKPSAIARIALVILALGFFTIIAINGGLNVLLGILAGILAGIFVCLGLSGLLVAAIGTFDQ